jgi:hypothetical protein
MPPHRQGGCGVSVPVTKLAVCDECGATFEQPPTGRPRRYCPDRPCRQRAYRKRRDEAVTKLVPPPVRQNTPRPIEELRREWYANSPEERREKREEIAAAALKRAEAGLTVRAADRALFANDLGRVAA